MSQRALMTAALAVAVTALVSADPHSRDDRRDSDDRQHGDQRRLPLVVGHRGATGYLPEHTLASYELAIAQGADYIEPDLVSTRDGVLIARHEVNITNTTNVADRPEFAHLRTTRMIDGAQEEGWFASDFTLRQIKTLRARQTLPFRPQQLNDVFEIPTFEEVLKLVQRTRSETGRVVGVYPETKHPTYHDSIGLSLEEPLVRLLDRYGLNKSSSRVFIQSFEISNLKQLNRMTRVRLIQLIDAWDINQDGSINTDPSQPCCSRPYDLVGTPDTRTYSDMVTPQGLAEIATYADGIGPWKRYIVSGEMEDLDNDGQADDDVNGDGQVNDADRKMIPVSSLIDDAHEAGLLVHAFTFRNEARFLLSDYGDDPTQEYLHFYCLGIDGLFSDNPDSAVTAKALFANAPRQVCEPWR